ncbi:MAG: hypothetical protein EAZ55_05975 [Cytophagales bacterium]|nr:MAG: hypothetical protein EAZ55_05975 [Cytophagales bacterium]
MLTPEEKNNLFSLLQSPDEGIVRLGLQMIRTMQLSTNMTTICQDLAYFIPIVNAFSYDDEAIPYSAKTFVEYFGNKTEISDEFLQILGIINQTIPLLLPHIRWSDEKIGTHNKKFLLCHFAADSFSIVEADNLYELLKEYVYKFIERQWGGTFEESLELPFHFIDRQEKYKQDLYMKSYLIPYLTKTGRGNYQHLICAWSAAPPYHEDALAILFKNEN